MAALESESVIESARSAEWRVRCSDADTCVARGREGVTGRQASKFGE